MFFLFGSHTIKKPVQDGVDIREFCQKCGSETRMIEYSWQKFFTLFFIPIFPIGEKESVLTCTQCETAYVLNENHYKHFARKQNLIKFPDAKGKSGNVEFGLVKCLQCNKHFNQIFTDCPICGFDSGGRAKCTYCNKVIEQFAFIQNGNNCPHCSQEFSSH